MRKHEKCAPQLFSFIQPNWHHQVKIGVTKSKVTEWTNQTVLFRDVCAPWPIKRRLMLVKCSSITLLNSCRWQLRNQIAKRQRYFCVKGVNKQEASNHFNITVFRRNDIIVDETDRHHKRLHRVRRSPSLILTWVSSVCSECVSVSWLSDDMTARRLLSN